MKRGSLPNAALRAPLLSRGWLAVSAMAILVVTVFPDPPSSTAHGMFLRSVVPRSLKDVADALLNIALFVPWGVALAGRGFAGRRAVVCGLLLSTAIEAVQTIVPGRDSTMRDIL